LLVAPPGYGKSRLLEQVQGEVCSDNHG
jgi:hypothetical protein